MHIKDALQAYNLALNLPSGSVVNFGTGKTVTVNEIAQAVLDITKSDSQIIHVDARRGEVQRLCADITKAKSLGFDPKTDFKSDLEAYISWVKK